MGIHGFGLDAYSRKARLAPVFIFMLPVGLAVACFFSIDAVTVGGLIGLASMLGLTMLFSQLGRDLGKRKEPLLFAKWCGKPSTRYLRHRDSPLNRETLERYHKKLRKLRRDIKIPTAEEEASDPVAADRVYEGCGDFLREKTRDTKAYPLIFAENVNYGFRRNLWAMKPAALSLVIVAILACSAKAAWVWSATETVDAAALGGAIGCIMLLVIWVLRFTTDWVKLAANAYAERLLAALETL